MNLNSWTITWLRARRWNPNSGRDTQLWSHQSRCQGIFCSERPARAWSWPFTSVYDWDKVFVKHAYWSACTGDLSFKRNVATARLLAKILLTCCVSCGSRCLLCRATFCFHVVKSSHPTEWLVIRRVTIFRNLKMRTLYQSSHSN
jgi:hypothetical protein